MPIPCRFAYSGPDKLGLPLPILTRTTCLLLAVALLAVAWTARAAQSHPAQGYIDRAAAGVRTDPEASARDARAALGLLQKTPDADLEIRAHLLLCDHLSERDRERVMSIDTRRWLVDRRITVSIGLTLSRNSGDTPSTMLQRADAALYDAKRAGRNCVKTKLPPSDGDPAGPLAPPRVEYA